MTRRRLTGRPVRSRHGSTGFLHGYTGLLLALLAVLLVAFLAVEALGVPLLTDPSPWLAEAGVAAAAVGVGLLLVDVLLPVPSSAVMVAHGALFGVVGGAALSVLGGTGATLVGFLLGRRSRPLVARLVPEERRERAEERLARYGAGAIVATRPVPMLAEATAMVAGTSRMPWRRAAVAGAVGNLVPALVYALAGAVAVSLADQALLFGLVLALAAGFTAVGARSRGATAAPRVEG